MECFIVLRMLQDYDPRYACNVQWCSFTYDIGYLQVLGRIRLWGAGFR